MVDDLHDRMDPEQWPDDQLLEWMRSVNALRDYGKAIDDRKGGQVSIRGPFSRCFLDWVVDTAPNNHRNIGDSEFKRRFSETWSWFRDALLAPEPMTQELFAFLATRVFSNTL